MPTVRNDLNNKHKYATADGVLFLIDISLKERTRMKICSVSLKFYTYFINSDLTAVKNLVSFFFLFHH